MARMMTGAGCSLALAALLQTQASPAPPRGVRLSDVSWVEAEKLLDPAAVVVVPLGAAAKEHGPHLKLNNDERLAAYLTARVAAASPVVIAPSLNYHYYPAFLEYPGSTSLTLAAARDLTIGVVRSLARYGPRRFYVLNTGISTLRALEPAARALDDDGILMTYTDLDARLRYASRSVAQQTGGSHADEIETSMMLYVDPPSVDMTKAVRDFNPGPAGAPLTRRSGGPGVFSPSGVYGDPTLATAEKGRVLVEALVAGILEDIDRLRAAPLPAARVAPPAPGQNNASHGFDAERIGPSGCTAGDERAIRNIGVAFTAHWANQDADRIGALWTDRGDMRHPDGTIERGRNTIIANRAALFARKEYSGTKHPVTLADIRCLSADAAIADGKWELGGLADPAGKKLTYEGLCTLVVARTGSAWSIEAWRYTIAPPPNSPPPPTVLKRPGWPG